jgi:hypothetical protein
MMQFVQIWYGRFPIFLSTWVEGRDELASGRRLDGWVVLGLPGESLAF